MSLDISKIAFDNSLKMILVIVKCLVRSTSVYSPQYYSYIHTYTIYIYTNTYTDYVYKRKTNHLSEFPFIMCIYLKNF